MDRTLANRLNKESSDLEDTLLRSLGTCAQSLMSIFICDVGPLLKMVLKYASSNELVSNMFPIL